MPGFDFKNMELVGAQLIENFSVGDNRGGFTKCYEKDIFADAGIDFQLNETFASASAKNVIRGLHFQLNNPQAKIVCVLNGKVWDVIVDLRRGSPTYKKWQGVELSAENHRGIYVPRGFAHGFLSLEDNTIMLYQCDGAYDKGSDTGIRFDDRDIGILWPVALGNTIHSARDLQLMSFEDFEKNYLYEGYYV